MTSNFFELFQLTPSYTIDLDELNVRYHQLQQRFHPDKCLHPDENRQALQLSSQINDAYQTLQSPLKRACYLLAMHGVELELESNTTFEPAFLMTQMELREALVECGHNKAALTVFLKKISTLLSAQEIKFSEMYARLPNEANAIKNLVREMFFYHKLKTESERFLWQS